MDRYNQLFKDTFKQPLSQADSAGLLEKTIADYPYFVPAHFYLLHVTERSTDGFAAQAKKTALLFNNNHWLNFQLLQLNQQATLEEAEQTVIAEEELASEVNIQTAEPASIIQDDVVTESDVTTQNVSVPGAAIVHHQAEDIEEFLLAEEDPEAPKIEVAEEPVIAASEGAFETPENADQYMATDEAPLVVEHRDAIDAAIIITNDTPSIEPQQPASLATSENASGPDATVDKLRLDDYTAEENAAEANDTQLVEASAGDQAETDAAMEQVSMRMAETLASISLDKNDFEDSLSFEPLHTSDYFASVGIKLSDEIKPADKLGLQLKSFTEWLKTMKKVHAEQLADTTTGEVFQQKNDKKIQDLAEASNRENEVLTEAMAEVYHQQGKITKAQEVYEKLSLLDPSKKIYFAAKINQLKD